MPLGVGRRFRTRSPRIRAAWAEGGREKHYCGASSSREGSEAARGRTGLTGSMLWIFFGKCSLLRINQRYRYLFFLGTPVGGGAPAPRLRRLQMLQRRGGTTLVIISMYTVCMWGGRWPGSRASDGRSRAPDVPAWAGPPAWASSGRAPPRSPEPPFALLSFGIFGDAEHFSVKRSVVVPLHSNLFGGFVHCRCWRGQARVPLIKLESGRRPSKGATAPQPAATLAPASTYTLLRRRPCHSHEVPIQRALCPPTERVTTVSQVL